MKTYILEQIRHIVRVIKYGRKADSETYIKYLKKKGMKIGNRTVIFDPKNTMIDETRPWMISIGDDVQITYGCMILTHGYEWSVLKKMKGDVLGSCGKVTIGNNVFIGMNSIILKGVEIGNNVIIGAGSVVCKNIPDGVVVAGNPARYICSVEEYYEKRKTVQISEANELAKEYFATFHQFPDDRVMSEFFFLWTGENDSIDNISSEYVKKMKLLGNYDITKAMIYKNKKQYESLEDFVHKVCL